MKYGIISDIHGNLEALESVLKQMYSLGVEQVINLGDSVGYGASPDQCISLLRKNRVISIMGNHDEAIFNETIANSFNQNAHKAVVWTKQAISSNNLTYLQNLPPNYKIDNILFIHGALTTPFGYIKNKDDLVINFQYLKKDYANIRICFFGHTHKELFSASINKKSKIQDFKQRGNKIRTDKSNYLINPGSVGQPRNNNPRSSFLIYDDFKNHIKHHFIEYDIKKAQKKIKEAKLPLYLAERLDLGI